MFNLRYDYISALQLRAVYNFVSSKFNIVEQYHTFEEKSSTLFKIVLLLYNSVSV